MADYEIGAGTRVIDGGSNYAHVGPGDRLLVPAGQRGALRFTNLRGDPGAPIVITNKGGQAGIVAGGGVSIGLDNCQHTRLTGAGDPGTQYGFKLTGFTNCGVFIQRGTEYVEVDHLEICDPGDDRTAGMRVHSTTDQVPAGWVQHDTHIHHCFVHDMGSSAFYVGKAADHSGTPFHSLEIDHCRVLNCGTDAYQIRYAPVGCHIHHNYAENMGLRVAGTTQGGAGLIVGPETAGRWHHNVIINADRGIQLLHHNAGVEISYNLLVHCGYIREDGGIRCFTTNAASIHHNTIVDSNVFGIRFTSGATQGEVRDNLVTQSGEVDILVNLPCTNNVTAKTVDEVGFVDPAAGNYYLTPDSIAVGEASDGGEVGAFPVASPVSNVIPSALSDVNGDGAFSHIKPGDKILIAAGERGLLRLRNLRGEPGAPIVIVNDGGQVRFRTSPGKDPDWACITMDGCQHVHLTGIGDPDVEYGFDLSQFTNCGLFVRRCTEYVTVDHLEIHHPEGAGGAGTRIYSRTDQSDADDAWIQHDTEIHHCYIHDVNREGMIIGRRSGPGANGTPLHWLEVYNCLVQRCKGSAFSITNVREGGHVHHNRAEDVGSDPIDPECAGFYVGPGTGGLWHDNVIVNATNGMVLKDHMAGLDAYRNLFVRCGIAGQQGGINWSTDAQATIRHNTIVESGRFGITTAATAGEIKDNVIAASGQVDVEGALPDEMVHDNVRRAQVEDIRFVDPEGGNYYLLRDSPARGAASDGSDAGAYPCVPTEQDSVLDRIEQAERLVVELTQVIDALKVAVQQF